MRMAIAMLLMVHGIAHLAGALTSWRIATPKHRRHQTTLFGGRLAVGDAGMRVVGLLWLLGALAFVAIGAAVLTGQAWWVAAATVAIVGSTVLCAAEGWAARIGIIVNLALLSALISLAHGGLVIKGERVLLP